MEDLSKHVSKEDRQMANRSMNRCSPSLIIMEIQIQITMRYHLIPARMAVIKKDRNNSVGEAVVVLVRVHCWWE